MYFPSTDHLRKTDNCLVNVIEFSNIDLHMIAKFITDFPHTNIPLVRNTMIDGILLMQ